MKKALITTMAVAAMSMTSLAIPAPQIDESPELAEKLYAGSLGFSQLLTVKRHPYKTTHVYTYHVESFIPGGGIYMYTPTAKNGSPVELLSAQNGEIMDLALSYDGKEILFSWKKSDVSAGEQHVRNYLQGPDRSAKTKYHIYRMRLPVVDRSGTLPLDYSARPIQLTEGVHNNFNPCWLPSGKIVFLSDRKESFAYCFVTTSPLLHRMDGDGSNVHRISHGYLNDFTPSVLNDGRIIYSRWEYVDRPAIPIQSLWTINPDGTDVAGFFGNRMVEPGTFMEAKSIGNTRKVLSVLTGHNGSCRGGLAIIDPAFGANARKGIQNVTPEIKIPTHGNGNGLTNKGPYENPLPIDENYYVVSRLGTLLLRDYDSSEQVTLLRSVGNMGFYSPIPIRSITPPPIIPSVLPKDANEPWATLFVQDVYNGLEPYIKRGEIKQICVVQEIEKDNWTQIINQVPTGKSYAANTAFGYQFPLISCGATYAPKKIWGYATVEEDGSAHFKVPAGIPVYFMAIDEKGRAVQRMRTFTHFQPGERHSCVGCHADRNYVTPHMSGKRPIAGLRKAGELERPEWGLRNFDYSTIVQPVLDKHCIQCHNAEEHPNGIDLTGDKTDFFNVSYDILARKGSWGEKRPDIHVFGASAENMKKAISPYTAWIPTINGTESNIMMIAPKMWGSPASKLADIILSGHPDKDGKPRVQVDQAGQHRLMAWMDLNVPYYSDSWSNYTDRMGCRRMLPPELKTVLEDVVKRRCIACHENGNIPRTFYTRITQIEKNNFLAAPLSKDAGGTGVCGQPPFKSKDDPDYQAILNVFKPITEMLKEKPRLDMQVQERPKK